MSISILILVIGGIGAILTLGGVLLSKELRGLDLKSVSGVLVALAVLGRYLLFLSVVAPIMLFVHYVEWRKPPNPSKRVFEHIFQLEFENQEFLLSSTTVEDTGLTTISDITGNVHFGELPGMTYLILFVMTAIWIGLAYQFLRHSETVLRSLYNRTPFVPGNDALVKKIAAYGLAIALIGNIGPSVLGWYLSQHYSIAGVTLSATEFSILRPLIFAGVIFVISEVFRVGRELKEENELTV